MARIGITYLDVEKAALQLQGQGKLPTVDRVRDLLGTGSKTTITEHLKRWKAEQTDSQGKLPQELSALVSGLWERLQADAEQRINELQSTYHEQIKELQQSLSQSQQEVNQLTHELHTAVERSLQLTHEKQVLEQQHQDQQQAQAQLEIRCAALQQQTENLKVDNTRLHQLAKQVQSNLEHYQQAMQSLRSEQALEIEKREATFQNVIQELKQALSIAQQEASALREKNQQKNYSLTQAEKTVVELQKQLDDVNHKWQ